MASYICVKKEDSASKGVRFATQANPYRRDHDPLGIDRDATPWQIWFMAVDAVAPQALKARVPEPFHGLIDGKDACPCCGAKLGYAPGFDRFHMELSCSACGGAWTATDAQEQERLEKWSAWQVEHHEPRSLSEYWAMQAQARGERDDVDSLIAEMGLALDAE